MNKKSTRKRLRFRIFESDEVKEAMDIAKTRVRYAEDAFKYMCGVLHTKLKQRQLLETNDDMPSNE